MAFTCGFFNSQNGDRKYNAEQMASIFDGLIKDGVYDTVGEIFAVTPGTGMQVLVGSGRAWFDHTWNNNDASYPLAIAAADVSLPRYDAVVLETNHSDTVRTNRLRVVTGTPASNPVKPTMASSANVKQHPLAYIKVTAGATAITQSMIQVVVGTSECPFVTGIIETAQIDALFQQWNGEFDEWFENLKAQLSDNVVANLQAQIDKKVNKSDVATKADIEAGTSTTKWVTPKGLKEAGIGRDSNGAIITTSKRINGFKNKSSGIFLPAVSNSDPWSNLYYPTNGVSSAQASADSSAVNKICFYNQADDSFYFFANLSQNGSYQKYLSKISRIDAINKNYNVSPVFNIGSGQYTNIGGSVVIPGCVDYSCIWYDINYSGSNSYRGLYDLKYGRRKTITESYSDLFILKDYVIMKSGSSSFRSYERTSDTTGSDVSNNYINQIIGGINNTFYSWGLLNGTGRVAQLRKYVWNGLSINTPPTMTVVNEITLTGGYPTMIPICHDDRYAYSILSNDGGLYSKICVTDMLGDTTNIPTVVETEQFRINSTSYIGYLGSSNGWHYAIMPECIMKFNSSGNTIIIPISGLPIVPEMSGHASKPVTVYPGKIYSIYGYFDPDTHDLSAYYAEGNPSLYAGYRQNTGYNLYNNWLYPSFKFPYLIDYLGGTFDESIPKVLGGIDSDNWVLSLTNEPKYIVEAD